MPVTFDQAERSASQCRPIDLFRIETPTATYWLTSHNVDVSYGGATYTALTMSRGNEQVAQDLVGRELVVYLPITHPLIQRFAASGIPEHSLLVTHYRLQEKAGIATQQHQGFGNSLSIDGHVALLRVPSLTDDAMKIRLPVVRAQKLCNHVLYDARCTVSRASATDSATITAISGTTITTSSAASGTQYVFGDIEHVATGQRRMVIAQAGSVLTINAAFVGAALGDAVRIAPGCDHSVTTCRDKFGNVINFGGHPNLNATINPWGLKGLGVLQQT